MSNIELLDPALPLLICPVCRARSLSRGDSGLEPPLFRDGRQLCCEAGHSFDIAKQGYANLLGTASPANADTPDMLAARDRFLSSGVYAPVRSAISHAVGSAHSIIEVGAGTGWYLSGVIAEHTDAMGLATDVSAAAAKAAARNGLPSIVADTWAGLPILSGSIDALLCVFAPRKADEFARLLSPAGRAIIAWPTPRHIAELRENLGLLDVAENKGDQLHQQLSDAGLQLASSESVEFSAHCSTEQLTDLVAMGPNAFHEHPTEISAAEITVSVQVEVFARN